MSNRRLDVAAGDGSISRTGEGTTPADVRRTSFSMGWVGSIGLDTSSNHLLCFLLCFIGLTIFHSPRVVGSERAATIVRQADAPQTEILSSDSRHVAEHSVGQADVNHYLERVKPLLSARCYACHGSLKQEAGLRVDTVADQRLGGDSGSIIDDAVPLESLLWLRVQASDPGERMPPEHEGEALTPEELAVVRTWLEAGAVGPAEESREADPSQHWAFQSIQRPAIPSLGPEVAKDHPIDNFIVRQHQRLGVHVAARADRRTLLRRLSLDLVGVPPTQAEWAKFLEMPEVSWYDTAVEYYLSDRRYGQRWARHWMDIWRYSDWWGLGEEHRNSQKHMHHWRDWIIESLNDDRSYADMIRAMLAADERTPEDLSELRATGFLARNFYIFNRHPWMEETVEHVGKGLLGLTTNCAKCHDHKYDPLSQREYYQLRAFFEPYQVRLDMLPGQVDLGVDALPRVFDQGDPSPTYLLIRGDEKQPDQTEVIPPDVPNFLKFSDLEVQPVHLPASVHEPHRRDWVVSNYVAEAEKSLQEARKQHASAHEAYQKSLAWQQEKIAEVASTSSDDSSTRDDNATNSEPLDLPASRLATVESFATWDDKFWKTLGGDWQWEPGQLKQRNTGAVSSALRWLGETPRDFEAELELTIHGGDQWRSVGIGFDVGGETLDEGGGTSAQQVYLSAYAGGPKVQAAYRQGSNWLYPAEAMRSLAVELERKYRLKIRVKDNLINAFVDDQLMLVWRSPLPRKPGHLQFTTFDAIATFTLIRIQALGAEETMQDAKGMTPDRNTLEGAAWEVEDRRRQLEIASRRVFSEELRMASIQARGAAGQVLPEGHWEPATDEKATSSHEMAVEQREALMQAVTAENQAAIAAAELQLAQANYEIWKQAPVPSEAVEKQKQAAESALMSAKTRAETPRETFTPLVAAKWSPTRFRFSGQDDPSIPFPAWSSGRRSAFAEWVVDPRHPLTARVAVNHLWNRHFGRPLVETVFDFGRNGSPPSHPELLDWLASELIETNWSMKHLHRLIVTSQTYQLGQLNDPEQVKHNLSVDPNASKYWQWQPIRMESQVVRDSLLHLAGQLDVSEGGPAIRAGDQGRSKRRSLYFFHSNNDRNSFLTAFDEAMVSECYRRESSVLPQQALALANSDLVDWVVPQIVAHLQQFPAGALNATLNNEHDEVATAQLSDLSETEPGCLGATRTQTPLTPEQFIRRAFLWVLGRAGTSAEIERCLAAWEQWEQSFPVADPTSSTGETTTATVAASPQEPNEAAENHGLSEIACQQLIWVLVNHHDFLTVR